MYDRSVFAEYSRVRIVRCMASSTASIDASYTPSCRLVDGRGADAACSTGPGRSAGSFA
jgi:hypothetical protein